YEFNNRPTWISIPLYGLLGLLDNKTAAEGTGERSSGRRTQYERARTTRLAGACLRRADGARLSPLQRGDAYPHLREARRAPGGAGRRGRHAFRGVGAERARGERDRRVQRLETRGHAAVEERAR